MNPKGEDYIPILHLTSTRELIMGKGQCTTAEIFNGYQVLQRKQHLGKLSDSLHAQERRTRDTEFRSRDTAFRIAMCGCTIAGRRSIYLGETFDVPLS